MAIDTAKLNEIEAMLSEDILTEQALATRLHEAGLPELARVVGQLARR
ncbi:hypothetical protein IU510_29730 [Nocardia cyriacigeorgica]|nr:hypothetical protein [Nocardia cyriacigeorgica]MBF6102201.1 hypothetical protein [Nocardia cyriacigeorgica]MBF6347360.1 hypothetical protein [Nocardia cyriacigeorgica]